MQPRLQRIAPWDVPVLQTWRLTGLGDFNAYLRWVLYREAKTAPDLLKVILWVDRTSRPVSLIFPASPPLHSESFVFQYSRGRLTGNRGDFLLSVKSLGIFLVP